MLKPRMISGVVLVALSYSAALPQNSSATSKPKFEVVSIRRNVSMRNGQGSLAPTPDGFRMVDMPLMPLLMTVYHSSGNASLLTPGIDGVPEWVRSDSYDIEARISDADRTDWQDPKKQPEMLRQMLEEMLAERCRLRIHRVHHQAAIYSMVVSKGGIRFHESKPGEPHPGAISVPQGGLVALANGGFHLYDTTMASFAASMSGWADLAIRDDTGLSGTYDLIISKPQRTGAGPPPEGAPDLGPTVFSEMARLGLKLEPLKGDVETLVIDNIEKPTAN